MTRSFLAPGETPPATPPRFPSKSAPGRPPRRRSLLGAVAAMVATPAVVAAMPAASPDADLIAACMKAAAAFDAARVAGEHPDNLTAEQARPYEEESDRLLTLACECAAEAERMQAQTRAGVLAKARLLNAYAIHHTNDEIDTAYYGHEAWAVVQELLRLEGRA